MAAMILMITLIILLVVGVPIAFALGISSLTYLLLFLPQIQISIIAQHMYSGINSFTLTAIPFFILVGVVMNTGGISRRLVYFARTLVGHLTGGMGIVALLSSMIFASISGSAVANAAGTGAITIPAMIKSGYPKGLAAAVESASSSLGAIIPPSIPFIVYGSLTSVSIGALFVGGYVPGILFAIGLSITLWIIAGRRNLAVEARSSLKEIINAGIAAFPALLTPIIIMGGILGGIMTPTEAGAIGVVYAFLVSFLVYHEIRIKDIPCILIKTSIITGMVMLVISISSLFGWIMALERIPAIVAEHLTRLLVEPWQFMLGIVALLIVVGTFIDTLSALIILGPVLIPAAAEVGIDPLHFGLIMCLALTFGCLTPPVGVVLFVTSSIADTTVEDTALSVLSFALVLIGGTFIFSLLPEVLLWLPRILGF